MSEEAGRHMRVVAPHFVAGLILHPETEICIQAAPILKWAVGKHSGYLFQYFERKGWEYKPV